MRRRLLLGVVALVAVGLSTCGENFVGTLPDVGYWTESGFVIPADAYANCAAGQDTDGDKIPDEIEGLSVDTDKDGLPDCADSDSDGDKIPDSIEAGSNPKNPTDSDGDKIPDYKEKDSDGDGINDGDEDPSYDGLLGCCLTVCNKPDTKWQKEHCPLTTDGCGKNQKCASGKCTPAVDFLCSAGETDPKKKVTFTALGKNDADLPTFVCRNASETGAKGLKPLTFKTSTTGQWHVAVEKTSTYGDITIAGAGSLEAGAAFDLTGTASGTAGFIVSMAALSTTDATVCVNQIISKFGSLGSVTQISSGTSKTSHDLFSTVVSTQLNLKLTSAKDAGAVRNTIFSTLLGKTVTNAPATAVGSSTTDHHIRFQTLLRKDGRMIVMGAVAATANIADTSKTTEFNVEDLSNGTGLATPANKDDVECDPFILSGTPIADIIWVIDESGSMDADRTNVANNAKDFFQRAVKSGLDFRMGITGVNYSQNGKFCSVASTDPYHVGGTDRFLTASEQTIFEACAKNPPGYEGGSEYTLRNARAAVLNHLPKATSNNAKIRTGATVVVIAVTDEEDEDWQGIGTYGSTVCTAPTGVTAFVQSDIALYTGVSQSGQGKAIFHVLGGVCKNSCTAHVSNTFGAIAKATGGIVADVCQANLGSSLQIIIDSITGSASPAKLRFTPMSASLAVAMDKNQLSRSRVSGFDFVASSNTLVFIGITYTKGSLVVASYRRWIKQNPLE